MYCLTLNPNHQDLIKKISYIPVGLGNAEFSPNTLSDKQGINISNKNPFYGEYTFHYWLWKNNVIDHQDWIGFCQYRKFWKKNYNVIDETNFVEFSNSIIKEISTDFDDCETIIGENFYVNQFRFSKFVKHNFKKMFLNPQLFFFKSKRNILFHFDMMHGDGNLEKAIDLLDIKEKEDFRNFVTTEVSFNPHNMFICKNKKILFKYYESVFPWLSRCEEVFGFESLNIYGLKRIYGFLAERYMSYWFKKYTRHKILPILFKDLSDFL